MRKGFTCIVVILASWLSCAWQVANASIIWELEEIALEAPGGSVGGKFITDDSGLLVAWNLWTAGVASFSGINNVFSTDLSFPGSGGPTRFDGRDHYVFLNFNDTERIYLNVGIGALGLAGKVPLEPFSGVTWQLSPFIGTGRAITGGFLAGTVVAVPEPETFALMLTGLGVLGAISRCRKTQ